MYIKLQRLSNNSKTEEKEGQIGLQIQKEAIFLVPKAIARQPHKGVKMMPPSDSAATSLPCHRYRSGHLTADKRLRCVSPKLPSPRHCKTKSI